MKVLLFRRKSNDERGSVFVQIIPPGESEEMVEKRIREAAEHLGALAVTPLDFSFEKAFPDGKAFHGSQSSHAAVVALAAVHFENFGLCSPRDVFETLLARACQSAMRSITSTTEKSGTRMLV